MDIAPLLVIFFAAFTAMLAFGSVLLICDALKKNNAHVRSVLGQLTSWRDTAAVAPSRADKFVIRESKPDVPPAPPIPQLRATRLDTEPVQEVIDPAADGTVAYIHPKSLAANRPVVVRNEPVKSPVEARQPIFIDTAVNDAAFTGLAVAIGLTQPDDNLAQLIAELVNKVTKNSGAGLVVAGDVYILTYPSDGRVAAGNMDELTEDLWELQLRSFATSPALLAWGVVEVTCEPLPGAIECASERLREAIRTRTRVAHQGSASTPAVYTSILGRLLALRNSTKVRSNHHPEITVLIDTEFPDDGTAR